jgi:MSHA pilin protein MshC
MPDPTRQQGFTIVELITVMVIIGVLAAVSAPVFFNVQVFRERGFFDETVAAVRYAQKHAVATHCTVRVVTTAGGFTLYGPATSADCVSGPFSTQLADPSGSAATFARLAPDGVTLSAEDFSFRADGSASFAGQTLSINVGGGQSFTVWQATGFVQTP